MVIFLIFSPNKRIQQARDRKPVVASYMTRGYYNAGMKGPLLSRGHLDDLSGCNDPAVNETHHPCPCLHRYAKSGRRCGCPSWTCVASSRLLKTVKKRATLNTSLLVHLGSMTCHCTLRATRTCAGNRVSEREACTTSADGRVIAPMSVGAISIQ